MQWWKRLSQSDAQQETQGSLMPFRFTQENCPGDFKTWFREVFFNECNWEDATSKGNQYEEANITLSVQVLGEDLGQKTMTLTHDEGRAKNHNAPTTHLKFDEDTKKYLQDNDMTGKYIIFSKDDLTGNFCLDIEDAAP
jgi:hypothetical protein